MGLMLTGDFKPSSTLLSFPCRSLPPTKVAIGLLGLNCTLQEGKSSVCFTLCESCPLTSDACWFPELMMICWRASDCVWQCM
ncbi:hypothetical protein MC885_001270 [Smutsia gigantea]|nr:hypothetical protein MC885_001270 [Smutsia gigantea]